MEKRENSFIQAVNEMSFAIPFHGHNVEGRGGGQSCSPPGCTGSGRGAAGCIRSFFIYLFILEEGEMFKSITTRPPLPHGGPAEPRCPPPPTLHQKPPTPSQFLHEPLAGFTNLPVTGVLAGNWELINVHLGG